MNQRIGIFAGSFDPVHKGHVAFALQALKEAKLDNVYFLPEIQPRNKEGITHVGHRIAMLKLALAPHPNFYLLELPGRQFSVTKTLPRLEQKFAGHELFLLMGSDVYKNLSNWPNYERLLKVGLIACLAQVRYKNSNSGARSFF